MDPNYISLFFDVFSFAGKKGLPRRKPGQQSLQIQLAVSVAEEGGKVLVPFLIAAGGGHIT